MALINKPKPNGDYYLTHTPQRPKFTIAKYVEDQGAAYVPKRLGSTAEGFEQDFGVAVRSEHPLEYWGPSGILDTDIIEPDEFDKRAGAKYIDLDTWHTYQRYHGAPISREKLLSAYGIPEDAFIDEVSRSYWELRPGINCYMYADHAREGFYYVGMYGRVHSPTRTGRSHVISAVFYISKDQEPTLIQGDYMVNRTNAEVVWPVGYGNPDEVIDMYEGIRRLERFDPNHLPIIEFQSDPIEGVLWFLQYHRGRTANYSTFEIGKEEVPKDAIAFNNVVGATPQDGSDIEVAICYGDGVQLCYDMKMFDAEVLSRLDMPVLIADSDLDSVYSQTTVGHGTRSLFSKPPLTLFYETDNRHYRGPGNIPIALTRNAQVRELVPGLEVMFAPMHVVSDGKTAFATGL